MPLVAVLVGLGCSLLIWLFLDSFQSRALRLIFQEELERQVGERAREGLVRFDRHIRRHEATVRLLAGQERLAAYLDQTFWNEGEVQVPLFYDSVLPPWLAPDSGWRRLVSPSYLVLLDASDHVREVYRLSDSPLPSGFSAINALDLGESEIHPYLTMLGDLPYVLASSLAVSSTGLVQARLLMLVPVDDAFLELSLKGASLSGAVAALVDAEHQRILASSEPGRVIAGTAVEDLWAEYEVTAHSFFEYEGSELNMQFATLLPRARAYETTQQVLNLARRQRVIVALAFVSVFTVVIFLMSERISRVLRRITRFSQRALGGPSSALRGGNQLALLEDQVTQFIRSVLEARNEMRRKHEAVLRDTQALQGAILDAALDCIITIDELGRIVEFNRTAEDIFQYRRDQVMGARLADLLLDPAWWDCFSGVLDACFETSAEGQGSIQREMVAVRADGTRFPVEIALTRIALDNRVVFTAYVHDITTRKRAEDEIKSLAKFPSESPSPVLRVNGKGVILYANAASEPLLAYWRCTRAQTLPEFWRQRVIQALESGEDREVELASDTQVYSILLAPVVELGYVNLYGREITAVRHAEQQMRQHQAELVHVCRLSTMGELATGLAHELNQPLSAIVNYASGCTRRLKVQQTSGGDLVQALEQITNQAERAGEIIKRLRTLVAKQPPVRAVVDINDLVREVRTFAEYEARKLGVAIQLRLAEDALPVRVDLVQIEQVLLNLIRNALDAVQEVPLADREVIVSTVLDDADYVRVSVQDNGAGIAPAHLQRLFDSFFTTKATGMGMGLPISRTIINDHKGRIWASSNQGRWTRFTFTLPAYRAEAGQNFLSEAVSR